MPSKLQFRGASDNDAIKVEFQLASKKANGIFSDRERNAIMAEGARAMGEAWKARWLPLRFTNYAKTLGYHVSSKYQKFKDRVMENPMPLIGPFGGGFFNRRGVSIKGTPLHQAAQGTTVTSTATAGRPTARIAIPTGHPVAPIVSQTLRNVPERERADIAQFFADAIAELLNDATPPDARGKRSLGDSSRKALNVGRKTAVSRAKNSRTTHKAG